MKARIRPLAVGPALACSATLGAHHGFAGEYDINKPVEVTGVVSKIEWTNPHARAKPFKLTFEATPRVGDEMMEYICNENNQYGIAGGAK